MLLFSDIKYAKECKIYYFSYYSIKTTQKIALNLYYLNKVFIADLKQHKIAIQKRFVTVYFVKHQCFVKIGEIYRAMRINISM